MSAWSSPGYRAWVIGGLVTIVVVSIVLGMSDPSGQWIVFVVIGMLAVYMTGIFVFQGRLASRLAHGRASLADKGKPAQGANPPTGWSEMSRVLAIEPIDAGSEGEATRGMGRLMMGQVRLGAVLCAAILVCVGLYYAGARGTWYPLGDSGPGFPTVFIPIFAVIIFAVLRIPFTLAAAQSAASDYVKPLGLAVTQIPKPGVKPRYDGYGGTGLQTAVRGPTVMEGNRHGRSVRIELDAGDYTTTLSGKTSAFKVSSDGGRLVAGERAPRAVREALEPLSADARWKSVEVSGGANGVVVERHVRATSAPTQQLWMDDLWLAERLADAAG